MGRVYSTNGVNRNAYKNFGEKLIMEESTKKTYT